MEINYINYTLPTANPKFCGPRLFCLLIPYQKICLTSSIKVKIKFKLNKITLQNQVELTKVGSHIVWEITRFVIKEKYSSSLSISAYWYKSTFGKSGKITGVNYNT